MNTVKKLLVAVDDSEASTRVAQYVAALVGKQGDFVVRLFHVLGPLAPGLLEAPGSENLQVEEKLEAAEQDAQARWLETAEQVAQQVFTKARTILREAGVPETVVETQFAPSVNRHDITTDILEEARANHCETIVVGRASFSRLRDFFHHHVADELVQKGQGFTIWVVE
jgi:nucleotide-binding universal stress UspA family protein